jgi:hypothetical protein
VSRGKGYARPFERLGWHVGKERSLNEGQRPHVGGVHVALVMGNNHHGLGGHDDTAVLPLGFFEQGRGFESLPSRVPEQ